jgi:hypothetical protein
MIARESTEKPIEVRALELARQWREAIERDEASGISSGIWDEASSEQKGYCAGELVALVNSSIESGQVTLQQLLDELAAEWNTEKIGEDMRSLAKEDRMRICALELKEAISVQ